MPTTTAHSGGSFPASTACQVLSPAAVPPASTSTAHAQSRTSRRRVDISSLGARIAVRSLVSASTMLIGPSSGATASTCPRTLTDNHQREPDPLHPA